jgi:hypothetical protein
VRKEAGRGRIENKKEIKMERRNKEREEGRKE